MRILGKKTAKNVVEEWVKEVKKNAEIACEYSDKTIKNEYIQRIIGNCNAILATLDCCKDEK